MESENSVYEITDRHAGTADYIRTDKAIDIAIVEAHKRGFTKVIVLEDKPNSIKFTLK